MYLKNVSFERVEAVKADTRTVIEFQPQEVKEVDDADAAWFMERYNVGKVYFKQVEPTEVPEFKEVEEAQEAAEEKKEQDPTLVCPVCGKVCASKMGLMSHMRTHK